MALGRGREISFFMIINADTPWIIKGLTLLFPTA